MNRPKYYSDGRTHEPKDVIKTFRLEFNLGNVVKYISRAGRKPGETESKDLDKALTYLQFEIDDLKKYLERDPYYVYQKSVDISDDMYNIYISLVFEDWGIDLDSDLADVLNYIFESSRHPFAKDIVEYLEMARAILEDWNTTSITLQKTHDKGGHSQDYISGWNDAMDDVTEFVKSVDEYASDFVTGNNVAGHCKASKL